jgi:uroporphyrinogen-III synthase
MQGNKPYLLCTQPLTQSMIDEAAAKGIMVQCLSLTETKLIVDPALEKLVLRLSETFLTAAFTSMQAVDSVVQILAGRKPVWKIFCTGPVTRLSVETYFGKDSILADGPSASALAEAILAVGKIERIVFFCSRQRRNELPEKLSREGILVQEVPVYETASTPQKISGHFDGIIFFSPGAVNSFFSANTLQDKTILFAIGKTTADTLAEYCDNEIILSHSPVKELLIEQAITYLQKKTIQHPGS